MKNTVKIAKNKTLTDIIREWDIIAPIRDEQIETGQDLSFHHILMPTLLELTQIMPKDSVVIDCGSGTGRITRELARTFRRVIGVDMSSVSIDIAKRHYEFVNNLVFVNTTIEKYAETYVGPRYNVATANMTMMDMLSLESGLQAINTLLVPGGIFSFTITHPLFWPKYWKYDNKKWFEYSKEIIIEAPFIISSQREELAPVTTHIHRPLCMYADKLRRAGFLIVQILEPMPNSKAHDAYPKRWKFPRFLAMQCVKISA